MRTVVFLAVGVVALALSGPGPAQAAGSRHGSVEIIQAVPRATVDVSIDGETVKRKADAEAVLGPYELSPGEHRVRFVSASGDVSMDASFKVTAGSSTDIVLHRPASTAGQPVVNAYRTPRKPIGPDKARVLIAHTATVAPADVRVDGKTIFTNIANGEFAEAELPAGHHKVELLPTGQTTNPILGPVDVTLAPRTVTMVYAVGAPSNGSMDVIAHTARVAPDGTVVPDVIDTGSAGLAGGVDITTFETPPARIPSSEPLSLVLLLGLTFVGVLAVRTVRSAAMGPNSTGGSHRAH